MKARVPLPLGLDLAGRRRRPSLLGWLMLAAGALACAGVLHEYEVREAQVADEARLLARARRAVDARMGSARPPAPVSDAELRPALAAARLLGRDWGGFLSGLEAAVSDPGIAVLALEQDGPAGSLKLSGEARSLSEVFALLARLAGVAGLRDARLVSYGFRDDDGVQVVSFQIDARWEVRP